MLVFAGGQVPFTFEPRALPPFSEYGRPGRPACLILAAAGLLLAGLLRKHQDPYATARAVIGTIGFP